MPVFTAAAAAVGTFFAGLTVSSVAAFAVRTLVTIGLSKLIANRANKSGAGASDVGARIQLGPATNNKLAVSYGSAFLGSAVTDAKITTDQKTMYYVFSICEATSGTLSFGKVFWNGKEVTLGLGEYGANNKIISLTTNATPPQVDTTINGQAFIYGFINGSSSGVNTGGTSAITILSDSDIPIADRWTATDVMTNTCFAVVKVIYNKDVQDAQQMPKLSIEVINTLTKPGAVLLDYMTDTAYGCAIDVADIDTASLTALDVYSDELITYVPVGGGSATQARYRIDGPVNVGDNCLSNLQQLVDACDSWLQYSELTGKWTIVINQPYSGVLGDLYSVDSSVLIGGIDINPIDLNQTYNSLEVQYPNSNINDQTDYKIVDLTTPGTAWYDPSLLSPNEPNNRLTIQYSQINNYVRAVYLGVRRLLQSREDLTIVCSLDYSGIQIVAGDVVRVTLAEYGFTDKLFRVSQVQETKTSDGFLGARITAFEYNDSIYADNALDDFIPEANTGLSNPNIISTPGTPLLVNNPLSNGNVKSFNVQATVPVTGTVLYMDFNYGYTNDVSTHVLYKTVSSGDGAPFTAGETIRIDVNDAPPGTYFVSIAARNNNAGKLGASSASFTWSGPGVTVYDPSANAGGIYGNNINGNIDLSGNILYTGANFTYSDTANLHIPGGSYAFYLQTDGLGNLSWGSGGNGTDNPGGANRAIQFNDEGNLGGVANFTYDKVTEIQRVPIIQLSNGAEKITTLATNGNLYMTGWDSPGNMVIPSLFYGNILNPNTTISPGVSGGTITIDGLWPANLSFTTGNLPAGFISNISFSAGAPVIANGNYYIKAGGQNRFITSNNGTVWANTGSSNIVISGNTYSIASWKNDILYIDNSFYMFPRSYGSPSQVVSSADLNTWTIKGNMFVGNTVPANANYSSALSDVVYGNNKFVGIIDANVRFNNSTPYMVAVVSSDNANTWTSSANILPLSNSIITSFGEQVFYNSGNYIAITEGVGSSFGNLPTRYAYSNDGITWNSANLPGIYANSYITSSTYYPTPLNVFQNDNTNTLIVYALDINGSNTAQVAYYTTSTVDGGNNWTTSNYAGNIFAIVYGERNKIFSSIDNEVMTGLNLRESNTSNGLGNTIRLFKSVDDGFSFTFVSNITAPNSVSTTNSIYDPSTGRIILVGGSASYFNYNTNLTVYSNEFSSTTTIPTIVMYDSNGDFYDDASIGNYQSLGSNFGSSMTMIIKTA